MVGGVLTCVLLRLRLPQRHAEEPVVAEAALTEIPEHLLARSKSRRAAMGGGGGDDAPAAATPATTSDAAPAPAAKAAAPAAAAAAPTPAVPDPVGPWVEAANARKKIPMWAVPVLAFLPIWAVLYALTLDPATPTEPGPLALGGEVYSKCAGCHGAGGGGNGAIPALIGEGNVTKVFPKPADQVTWIALGTSGYQAAGIKNYAPNFPVGGSGAQMPAWLTSLTAEELMSVVLHEREALNGEKFDIAVWEDGFEETLMKLLPADKVAEYMTVLEEWKANPPV